MGNCVDIASAISFVQGRLDSSVVGYACCIGNAHANAQTCVGGSARTAANAPVMGVGLSTKFQSASVSKVFTALPALQLLTRSVTGAPTLQSAIRDWLPTDWAVSPTVGAITFGSLLCHRSGIRDAQNVWGQDYKSLKDFLTSSTIDVTDKSESYSNTGFALFRILLPSLDGMQDDTNLSDAVRAQRFATAYIQIVNQYVFGKVSVSGVSVVAPKGTEATSYALAYQFPGTAAGYDWGTEPSPPLELTAGAGGWWVSINDLIPVLISLNRNDGKILTPEQMDLMQGQVAWDPSVGRGIPLGFDVLTSGDAFDYRYVEKNGGLGADGTTLTTTICSFGSPSGLSAVGNAPLYGALLLNSDVRGGVNQQGDWHNCYKCGGLVFAGNPSAGMCPCTGDHETDKGGHYLLDMNVGEPGGKAGWKWCSVCQALCSTVKPGVCSGNGGLQHEFPGSQYYVNTLPGASPRERQTDWLLCANCQVLTHTYGPTFCCAAGGNHDTNGSEQYYVQVVVAADTVLLEALELAVGPCPRPCEEIRNELLELSAGDFQNFQAYEKARQTLRAELAECERMNPAG